MRDCACASSRTLIVIMLHDLSLALNVQKRNIKETPGNDSHILSFIISVFINFSLFLGNIHHFLYLSSIILAVSVYCAALMAAMTVNGLLLVGFWCTHFCDLAPLINCRYARFR